MSTPFLKIFFQIFSFKKNAALFKASNTVQWYGIDAVLRPINSITVVFWFSLVFREVAVLDDVLEDFSSLRTNLGLSARQAKFVALYAAGNGNRPLKEIAGDAGYKFPEKTATGVRDKILAKPGVVEWLNRHWSTSYQDEVIKPSVAALLEGKGRKLALAKVADEAAATKDVDSFFRAVDMLNRMDGAYSIKHEMSGGVAVKVVWGDEDG